jgi:large conductance mechanosensitive channel
MNNFITFIREQGVVGLAIGFILGGSVSKVVSSIVNDLVNPLLSILLGKVGDLNDLYIQIGEARIKWGSFINNLIDFVVIALVVYVGIKLLKLDKLDKKANK